MFCRSAAFLVLTSTLVLTSKAQFIVGTLRPSGEVLIGNADLRQKGVSAWPLVAGDVVTTGAEGTARVSASNGQWEIQTATTVLVESDAIVLRQGTVASERTRVKFGTVAIEPLDATVNGWFVVGNRDDKPVIAVQRGSVVLRREGEAPLVLHAGSYATPQIHEAGTAATASAAATAGSVSGTVASAASTGWSIGALGHGASVALLAGSAITAATVTAAGLAGQNDLPDTSPSVP